MSKQGEPKKNLEIWILNQKPTCLNCDLLPKQAHVQHHEELNKKTLLSKLVSN